MIDFKSVKSLVTAREAAEHYGLTVNRHGMALCPFHDDHNHISSMKQDKRFHFFGYGENISSPFFQLCHFVFSNRPLIGEITKFAFSADIVSVCSPTRKISNGT